MRRRWSLYLTFAFAAVLAAMTAAGRAVDLQAQGQRAPLGLTLRHPGSVAVDSRGAIYLAETGSNGSIDKISASGNMQARWTDFRPSILLNPQHVVIDTSDRVFVSRDAALVRLDGRGKPDGGWRSPTLPPIQQLAAGLHGQIIVASGGKVVIVSPRGRVIHRAVLRRSGKTLRSDGLGVGQTGIIYDLIGSTPRACTSRPPCPPPEYFVQTLSPTGRLLASWQVVFSGVQGLAVNRAGGVYVGIDATSRFLGGIARYSLGGLQETSWGLSDCTGATAFVAGGLAIDRQGNLYETDSFTGVLLKISPVGKVIRRWGNCSQ